MTDSPQGVPETPTVMSVDLDLIEKNAWNANEMTSEEFAWLVSEIKENGFIEPLHIVPMVDGSYRILGGAHRYEAAKTLGYESLPCVILSDARWQDEDLQKFVTVRLNSLHGKPNPDKLAALYREMATKYGEKPLRRMFAFTDLDGWKKLVHQVQKGIKATGLPKQTQDKISDAVGEAKTLDDLGTILNKMFNEHGDTMEYSFMVFSYGGKEHVYVALSKKTKKAVDRVLKFAREWGHDVNEVIGKVTERWVKEAEAREKEELEGDSEAVG